MAKITLPNGSVCLVDDEDYARLSQFKWKLSAKKYAAAKTTPGRKGKQEYMHRMILNAVVGMYVDHINGDGLDNRKNNLRLASKSQNGFNRGVQKNNSSGIKGIVQDKRDGVWMARIGFQGRKIHLGRFESAELAHEFRCLAAEMIHGEFVNHG